MESALRPADPEAGALPSTTSAGEHVDRPSDVHHQGRLRLVGVVGIVLACLAVWAWRRPDQLLHPYVWDEEGVILSRWLTNGYFGAVHPISGYVEFPANVLVALSAQLDFSRLPVLEYLFASLVFVITVLILVVPESRWGNFPARCGMAFAMCLIPTNPEVFGVLLYSFWWATLWPAMILGWRKPHYVISTPLLIIGALASPAGGALFLVYGASFILRRRRQDLVNAILLLAGFAFQLYLATSSSRASETAKGDTVHTVAEQMSRTVGFFISHWATNALQGYAFVTFIGFVLSLVLLVLAVRRFHKRNEALLLLWLTGLIYTGLSSLSGPLSLDPVTAGPRYFFLPFTVIAWICVSLLIRPLQAPAGTSERPTLLVRLDALGPRIGAAALVLATFSLPAAFARSPATTVARLDWAGQLRICGASAAPTVAVPIYYDGSDMFWNLMLTPQQCRHLAN